MDIVKNERRGLWNVPYISACYLIQGYLVHNKEGHLFQRQTLDPGTYYIKKGSSRNTSRSQFENRSCRHGLRRQPPFRRRLLARHQQAGLWPPRRRRRVRDLSPPQRPLPDQAEPVRLGIQAREIEYTRYIAIVSCNSRIVFRRYLHDDYADTLERDVKDLDMACPDVYWFPMVTDRFADELVAEMENFGQWSSGTNTV